MKKTSIEYLNKLPTIVEKMVEEGHAKDEKKSGTPCHYKKFALVSKNDEGKVFGVLSAYTAYAEVYVDDIWVHPDYRKQGNGKRLLLALEERFEGKGFNNINLVTSAFQAPDFYKKCGFQLEFVRENKENPKLTKFFFVKFF
ncbi:GNAT family N-acetyltransferase [Simkania sp.]|uniref:GNAT family N-acetyltransferase n=1 Tax=Simkania sp. TaxID=34094 RepID=UPI003B51ACCA